MFSVDSILQRNKRPKMMKTFYGEHFTSKQTEPKCWMENTDVVNGLFLILKISDVTCQHNFILKKYQLKLNIYMNMNI